VRPWLCRACVTVVGVAAAARISPGRAFRRTPMIITSPEGSPTRQAEPSAARERQARSERVSPVCGTTVPEIPCPSQLPACNRTAFFSCDHREVVAGGLSQPSAHRGVLRSVNRRLGHHHPAGVVRTQRGSAVPHTHSNTTSSLGLILTIFMPSLAII